MIAPFFSPPKSKNADAFFSSLLLVKSSLPIGGQGALRWHQKRKYGTIAIWGCRHMRTAMKARTGSRYFRAENIHLP